MSKKLDASKARKYLTLVNLMGKSHVRRLTYRERWYKKHGLLFKPRTKKLTHVTAQDGAVSLQQHDDQYHEGHYEEGQKCRFRDTLAKKDSPDAALNDVDESRPSWITPEMDAEYAEAFDAMEDAEDRHDVNAIRKYNKLMNGLLAYHARHAFAKSKVKDEGGSPKILYHGTKKGGFTIFEVDGEGKTKGTGAWFTDMMSNAMSYSGSNDDVVFPTITARYLRREGYLKDRLALFDPEGEYIGCAGDTENEVWENAQKLKDDWLFEGSFDGFTIGKVYGLSDFCKEFSDCIDANFETEEEAVEEANKCPEDYYDVDQSQSCIYSVYVNMTDPDEIDAHEDNWDEIKTEWMVYDSDGEFIDGAWSQEDAEKMVERLKSENPGTEYEIQSFGRSTDELVREARECGAGYDGFIIRNCSDGGSYGYGCDITNDYIVFDARNIKMADMVTFDDDGSLIPLSKRFDFTKYDVRF